MEGSREARQVARLGEVSLSPVSPAATAMPGGSPLKRASTRPCKYGPRDAEGKCPKKPRTSSAGTKKPSSSSANKRPCKYGPRDANGLCPKKPKSPRAAKAPSVREYKSVDSAARQAGEVLRSKKATKEQKHEAVKVLGSAVAGEATKKVGESVAREAKKAVRQNKDAIKSAAKSAGKAVAGSAALRAGVTGAAIAGTLYVGGKVLDANRAREAKKWADQQLAATRKKLPKLTPEQAATLWNQYYQHALKKPVTNSFSGK